jgi:hypothetical protein
MPDNLDRPDDFDERDRDFGAAPVYPVTVTLAGTVWILFGCLILINAAAVLALGLHENMAGGIGVVVLLSLFALAFLFVGVQSVRGTAPDTLGNGAGSIIFALLELGSGVANLNAGQYLQAGVGLLLGLGLLAAGILALVGRGEYKAWRRAAKAGRLRLER